MKKIIKTKTKKEIKSYKKMIKNMILKKLKNKLHKVEVMIYPQQLKSNKNKNANRN